jgi:peptidyl-prolyl cis-trans isomerase A (cyclophilin A)
VRFLVALFAAAAAAYAQQSPPPLPNGLYAVFSTSAGQFIAKLYEKDTPIAVANFVGLAQGTKAWLDPKTHAPVKRPLYDNLTFFRVRSGEMIQSGSADNTTHHNCGIMIRDEFLPGLRFDRSGKLAVANSGGPDTGGCQFFITVGPMQSWDGKYTIFGTVVQGLDVVERINHAPLHDETPVDPVKLNSVSISRVGPEPPQKPQKKK